MEISIKMVEVLVFWFRMLVFVRFCVWMVLGFILLFYVIYDSKLFVFLVCVFNYLCILYLVENCNKWMCYLLFIILYRDYNLEEYVVCIFSMY